MGKLKDKMITDQEQEHKETLEFEVLEGGSGKVRKEVFTFDEKRHVYELDGQKLTGVTTILGVIAKPALIPWAVKMTAEAAKKSVKALVKEGVTKLGEYDTAIDEAKKAHRKTLKDAGNIGTEVHNAIEDFIKHGTQPNFDGQKEVMFNNFLKWADENVSEFVESEKRLYSKEYWFAGTVDLVFKDKDGKIWIGDIKTSSGVYPEYFAQMGGYHVALEEMEGDMDVAGYVVVRLGKDGAFEVVGFNDTEMCKQMFLHANGLYKIKNNLVI